MTPFRYLFALTFLAACGAPTIQADGGTGGGLAAGGGTTTSGGGSAGGGSASAGGTTGGGSTAGGTTAGGSTAGGSTAGGSTAGGSTAGGSTAGGSTAGGSAAAMSFEPMGPGWSWTYDTTDPLSDGGVGVGSKVVTVQTMEAVPGKTGVTAWKLHTLVPGSQTQLTWQEETANGIFRHRDDAFLLSGAAIDSTIYTPSKLRIRTVTADLATGATYVENYSETVTVPGMAPATATRMITWRVINGAEQITVPAGTFTAVHIERKRGATADKEYWFVRGVGKVRELAIGTNRVEVLRSYTHP